MYYTSIEKSNIDNLSSSFYYYLSKLYSKKIGNPGNELMEYICLKKAIEQEMKIPGNGTIISYYRKKKSLILFDKNKINFYAKIKEIKSKGDSEGYGDDNSICPICMENKRSIMFVPCKHQFCKVCTEILKKNSECPICRGLILFYFDYINLHKEDN